MVSDWAVMRALAAVDVLGPKPGGDWSETVKKIAAALDEARDEGRKEVLGNAVPLKDLMSEALDDARREGAERERWECHRKVLRVLRAAEDAGEAQNRMRQAANDIAARGPMRGPEEE